jgi:metal-responsive CopG/Arc/MetJ family transcriptional regulator
MSKERTSFTLSQEVKQELEHMVAKNHRSEFVEQAIVEALKHQHQKELFSLIDNIEPVSIDQTTETLIRGIRQSGLEHVEQSS